MSIKHNAILLKMFKVLTKYTINRIKNLSPQVPLKRRGVERGAGGGEGSQLICHMSAAGNQLALSRESPPAKFFFFLFFEAIRKVLKVLNSNG